MNSNNENNKSESNLTPDNLKGQFIEIIKTIAQVLVLVCVIRMTFIEPFKIPSESMIPTLLIGDHILVNKLSYGIWAPIPFRKHNIWTYSIPDRGDVVVFTRDLAKDINGDYVEEDVNLIKRVVGLPGETIEVRDKDILINNKKIEQPWDIQYVQNGVKDFGPQIIPENHIFVMGDNRDRSRDSRFWQEHFVPLDQVKGRAFFIYFNSKIFSNASLLTRIFKVIH